MRKVLVALVSVVILALCIQGINKTQPKPTEPVEQSYSLDAEYYSKYMLAIKLAEIAKKNQFTDDQIASMQEYLRGLMNDE